MKAELHDKKVSDITLKELSKISFTQSEKKLTTNLVQGCIRMRGRLDWELNQVIYKNYFKLKKEVKIILQLGTYQIKYLDSIPNYAAVNTSVDFAKLLNPKYGNLVNAALRRIIKDRFIPPNKKDIKGTANYLSHPYWLFEKWIKQGRGETIEKLAKWNNSYPKIWFRVNILNYSCNNFINFLKENNIHYDQYLIDKNYFSTNNTSYIINSEIFKNGKLSIQDPSAGLVCHLLDPKENDTILDVCAAPGGKTAYLSQLMNNKGKIYAYDNDSKRIEILKDTIKQLDLKNVVTKCIDSTKAVFPLVNKIILDAPCSGTGVLGKRADLRWRKSYNDILEMAEIQKKLLWNSSKYLKSNGIIVYSTCSIEPEENINIINDFLENHLNFQIIRPKKIVKNKFIDKHGMFFTYPPIHGIDGGYAAILKKNDK